LFFKENYDRLLAVDSQMFMLEIKALPRQELGRKTNKQRKAGQIPAVIYGHGIKSEPLYVGAKEFSKVYSEAGESALITVEIDNKKRNVLIHDVAKDVLDGGILHVDFYQVRMDEKIKTKVPLVFIGESLAVKAEAGVLVKNMQEVEIEALPKDLPHHLDVDIGALQTFEDRIFIKDLNIFGSIKVLSGSDEIVASVIPPRSEEELAALEEKVEEKVEEVKVVGEEKKAAEAEAAEQKPEEKKAEEKV
jgi:large subunit ribosomal protein L25